jgi:WhiB family redox-sensing transcriptional regulator
VTREKSVKLPTPLIQNYEWQQKGNCVGVDTNVFFPESNLRGNKKIAAYEAAKTYCRSCEVISECLQFALDTEEPHGVYGGLSEEERNRVLLRRKNYRVAI